MSGQGRSPLAILIGRAASGAPVQSKSGPKWETGNLKTSAKYCQRPISGILHMRRLAILLVTLCSLPAALTAAERAPDLPWIAVSKDHRGFVAEPTDERFVPWGFNYDRDSRGRLLEDYWDAEWNKVEADFAEMKRLGANVVRVHLQFGRFMLAADTPNQKSLDRLEKLAHLAERERFYLDLTGLGCYHKADVPAWYDRLDEHDRWESQSHFWSAVAERCAKSPAIFCYDLMNEPVVPGGKQKNWLAGPLGDKYFVQFISKDCGGRSRTDIARDWIRLLTAAIRQHDNRHLITVGLIGETNGYPGWLSGFVPAKVAGDLDYLSAHIYPESGKIDEALKALSGFAVGKPVVIEEMYPLKCSMHELEQFINGSKKYAAGWIGFYWGASPAELEKSTTFTDMIQLGWLKFFQQKAKQMTADQAARR